jgi:hypothetical protein
MVNQSIDTARAGRKGPSISGILSASRQGAHQYTTLDPSFRNGRKGLGITPRNVAGSVINSSSPQNKMSNDYYRDIMKRNQQNMGRNVNVSRSMVGNNRQTLL